MRKQLETGVFIFLMLPFGHTTEAQVLPKREGGRTSCLYTFICLGLPVIKRQITISSLPLPQGTQRRDIVANACGCMHEYGCEYLLFSHVSLRFRQH